MINIDKKTRKRIIIISAVIIGIACICGYFIIISKSSHITATLKINEYMTHNTNTLYDSEWDTPDWIEIYNYGQKSIWLGDIYISDDSEIPRKFLLPDKYIDAGEYLIIYASDKKSSDEQIHASFKLGDKDKAIVLSYDENQTIDMCKIETLPQDVSAGINDAGQWRYYATPTPSFKNNTPQSETADIASVDSDLKKIIINEYMSNNQYTLKDSKGASVDWIELYNPGDEAIWIGNLYISDNPQKPNKFLLPDYYIGPGEYLLIYADSKTPSGDTQIYAPFSLSVDEQIILSNNNGKTIDTRDVELLPGDISAGLHDEVWVYFQTPTPGYENTTPASQSSDIQPFREVDSQIYINEFMTNNEYSIIDSFGDLSDWVEIYNPNDYDVLLEGYGLSDDEGDRLKWVFPKDTVIKANGYLLVFASGNDIVVESNSEIHASFALGKEDTVLVLCQPNLTIVDSVDIMSMPGNVSKGRLASGEYGYFTLPTPLSENIGGYVDSVDGSANIILQDVYISEVSSSQVRLTRNAPDYLTEYIEIYNKGDEVINLEGYSITDGSQIPWMFPKVNIEPKGYLVLLLKGEPDRFIPSINANLSISASGEELIFKNNEGAIIDYFRTGYLTGEYSSGRKNNAGAERYFFSQKTPGKENPDSTTKMYSQKSTFSHDGGMVEEDSFLLEITADEGSIIRYTLDGSTPKENSKIYSDRILINQDTVVRTIVFEENKLPSSVASVTYIFSRVHTLPIVCLSTDFDYLFSEARGIYAEGLGFENSEYPYYQANFWFDWERPVSFEFYEINTELAIKVNAGIQISGQTSRVQDQKSLIIRIREEYGLNELYYPFFEDNEVQEFKHILLRTSGQDSTQTKIRDYYFHQSVKKYSDLDMMDGRPTAVYINAQYWGIYNIREKINADYLVSHHDVDPDNITIIEGTELVNEGNNKDWIDLRNFCTNNDFSNDLLYEQLEARVDVDAFIDYVIVQAFFCNNDYANVKYWRDNSDGGKWRPILFDLDAGVNSYNYTYNRLNIYFKEGSFSNILFALEQNNKFREKFIERYAYFLNEVFTEENINNDIDGIIDVISLEMKYHIQRWGQPYSVDTWLENVLTMKKNIIDRRGYMVEHLANRYDIALDEIESLFPWYGN